jgi:hypothetical protein
MDEGFCFLRALLAQYTNCNRLRKDREYVAKLLNFIGRRGTTFTHSL